MDEQASERMVDGMPVEKWLAIRKEAGLKIGPDTVEVLWTHALTLDPHGSRFEFKELFMGCSYLSAASMS